MITDPPTDITRGREVMSILDLMLILTYQHHENNTEEPPIIMENSSVHIPNQWYIDPTEALREIAKRDNEVFCTKQKEALFTMTNGPWKPLSQQT
jgi:hypothetical protein